MENECKKCNVVHNSLADKCFSCGTTLKRFNAPTLSFGFPTLLVTTFLSLSVVFVNVNLVFGG